MKSNRKGYSIPITWEILYNNIFCEFAENQPEYEPEEFLKQFFPETVFPRLFPWGNGAEGRIQAFFKASADTQAEFQSVQEWILSNEPADRKKIVYTACQATDLFRGKWEAFIPFSRSHGKRTSQEKIRSEREKRSELEEAIADILLEIPPECDRLKIGDRLTLLNENGRYSLVLGILSVIASSLSAFDPGDGDFTDKDDMLHRIVLPRPQTEDNEMASTRLESGPIRITWKMLHKEIYLRLKDSAIPDYIPFLGAVIPGELLSALCAYSKGDKAGQISNKRAGSVYHANNGASSHFTDAKEYIIRLRMESGEAYSYGNSPVILGFKENWERLLPVTAYPCSDAHRIPEEMKESAAILKGELEYILRCIPDEPRNLRARLTALFAKEPCSMVLAVLSVIASTLFCFNTEEKKLCDSDRALFSMVLPPLPEKTNSPALVKARARLSEPGLTLTEYERELNLATQDPLEMGEANFLLYQKAIQANRPDLARGFLIRSVTAGYQPAIRKQDEEEAARLLSEVRQTADREKLLDDSARPNKGAARVCCEKCEKILRLSASVPEGCRGEVSFLLYKCISNGHYTPPTGETAEHYLELSRSCGYEKALEVWENTNSPITPRIAVSSVQSGGICYCNTDNPISATFEKTVPPTWDGVLYPLDVKKPRQSFFDGTSCRFLLVDDDFRKNAADLFELLQLVKTNAPEEALLHWEIFLRHDSETIRALVDTALSRLPDYRIPVYIINDSKAAAQQLLSRHPLFFPVRSVSLAKKPADGAKRPLLHFVVLGTTDVAQWLVREAFWMMGFRNNAIASRITILAEDGEVFENRLKGRYPGMVRSDMVIEGIDLPEIVGKSLDLSSGALSKEIADIIRGTPYCYFAVAAGSDEINLTLATRIREALVRRAIHERKEEALYQMPPIAFLCRDDQTAWLSRSMVIEKEEHGSRWYNTWSLIPFGELSGRYTFDEIAGGTFDTLAKCVHYQFSQVSPYDVARGTPKAEDAAREYYRRQYNQDSSYSMALGMPYRLFQFRDAYGLQIFPSGWSILERTVYSSVTHLKNLASRLKPNPDAEEIREIAEWGHARWVRWMLSRGWLPISAEEAVFAVNSGNLRQQIFVSRQHPCICSYKDLEDLQTALKDGCDLERDFFFNDLRSVQDTRKLLSLEWFTERIAQPQR